MTHIITRSHLHWLVDPDIISQEVPPKLISEQGIIVSYMDRPILTEVLFSELNFRTVQSSTSNNNPSMLDDPGLLYIVRARQTRRRKPRMYSPSLEPDTPWLVLAFKLTRSERSLLFLPSPEEKGIVGMTGSVDWDIACPIARNRACNVGQRCGNLKVCIDEATLTSWQTHNPLQ